ncbi:MAG: hypothetical protein JW956_01880, partial [Calditrichaceae bacterium]|nr:hypothetical protein [Calditrichaceae bacterium]
YIFILVIIVLLINCSEKDPIDPDPPNKVIMVLKEEGFDTLEVERGIDAAPNPDKPVSAIELNWYEPLDKYRVAYYNIYRTVHDKGKLFYELIGNTENQINLPDTVFIDTTLTNTNGENPYWYYVTAVNEDGKESEPSDTVYYTLIDKAAELSINNNSPILRSTTIAFTWRVSSIPASGYYLRVEQIISENFTPIVYFKDFLEDDIDYSPPQTYSVSVDSFFSPVNNGSQYRWRIDCKGNNRYMGAESDWSTFTVDWSNQ